MRDTNKHAAKEKLLLFKEKNKTNTQTNKTMKHKNRETQSAIA